MTTEFRALATAGAADTGEPILLGYAARYNVEATIAGTFREIIKPAAFREAVRTDDVRGLFNHLSSVVLGRTRSGTLALSEDNVGLAYRITINPDDAEAMSVWHRVRRNDVNGSSFAFEVKDPSTDEEWQWPKGGTMPLRILHRLSLVDVSPVTFPAYPQTSVSARRRTRNGDDQAQRRLLRARIELARARHL